MFLCVQEKNHHQHIEEAGDRGIKGNGAAIILELDVTQGELRGTLVRISFLYLHKHNQKYRPICTKYARH